MLINTRIRTPVVADLSRPIGIQLSGHTPPQGDRKGPIHSSSLLPPLQRHGSSTARFVIFVRAGVGWCGAGTLAVALRWGLSRPPPIDRLHQRPLVIRI